MLQSHQLAILRELFTIDLSLFLQLSLRRLHELCGGDILLLAITALVASPSRLLALLLLSTFIILIFILLSPHNQPSKHACKHHQ